MSTELQELLDVYDRNGNKQGRTVLRGEPLAEGDFVLIVQIWVRNSQGDYLIQKRAASKRIWPDKWAATAGVVSAGETGLESARRELGEEMAIWVEPDAFQRIRSMVRRRAIEIVWLLERDVADESICLQEEEVTDFKWVNETILRQMVADGSFYDYGSDYFATLFAS